MMSITICQILHWTSKQEIGVSKEAKKHFHDKENKKKILIQVSHDVVKKSLMSKSKHAEKTIGLCYSIERNVYTYAWLVYFLHILSYRLCE